MHRKATILSMIAQKLGLRYADNGGSGIPVPRPFLGGNTAGFHYAPSPGDQVIVHHEEYAHPYPTAATSCTDSPQSLYPLISGESAILHTDGRAASYLKADGTTVIWSKSGQPSSTVDANGNVTLGANATVTGTITKTGGAILDSTGIHNAKSQTLLALYNETRDSTGALTPSLWENFWNAVSFTVVDANSTIEINLDCAAVFQSTASNNPIGWRVQIDSLSSYPLGNCYAGGANLFAPYSGGRAFITGLSAGVHSAQVQYFVSNATNYWTTNATSPTFYHWVMAVIERRS